MSETPAEETPSGFRDLLKTPWVRNSLILGAIIVLIGVVILYLMKAYGFGNTQLFSDTRTIVTQYGLPGIFLVTIVAGTILPVGSPALVVLAALLGVPPIPLILVATTGFTIGMMVNYALAYRLGRPYLTKKMSAEKLDEMTRLWGRWGWVLYTIFGLIPVLPVELLSFICGLLKTKLALFLLFSFVPRLIVFAILAYFGKQAGAWMGV